MEFTGRDEILMRYRKLRKISVEHHTKALAHVSTSALLAQGKRLGLVSDKRLNTDDEGDLAFLWDLLMYAAPAGRTRAIDRYARACKEEPAGDEAALLQSMQSARFSLWRVERRHEVAGVIVRDLIREDEWWLVDEGLEASATPGTGLALRLFQASDGFAMSCGVLVALDRDMIDDLFDLTGPLFDKHGPEAANDRRFAEGLYKTALLLHEWSDVMWRAA